MTVISQQVNRVYHQGKTPTDSADIGVSFKNYSVITRKMADNVRTYAGENNILMGFQSGGNILQGKNNVLIGSYVGENFDNVANDNTVVGDRSARYLESGQKNILIGKDICKNNYSPFLRYNTIVGNDSDTNGTHNTIIGNSVTVGSHSNLIFGNYTTSSNSNNTIIGNNNICESPRSMLIGDNLHNYGSNSAILLTNNTEPYYNYSNDHINLFNILRGTKSSHFEFTEKISFTEDVDL